MAGPNKNWREILQQRPLNERLVAMYGRLMDAEERLEPARQRQGVSGTALGDAIEASEEGVAPDVYVDALTRYVAALGGHLEVRAVFPEETITLLREPAAT